MSSRSLPRLIVWLGFTSLLLAILFALNLIAAPWEADIPFVLLALYGLQGLVAELVGFCADEWAVSFPRRIFPAGALFVFWRKKIPADDLSRIDTIGHCSVRFSLVSAKNIDVVVPGRDGRRRFMTFARHKYPWVDVF